MADPLTEYQKVLASRGIGGVFQEEGPSRSGFLRTIDDGSSILNGASPSSVTDFIDAGAHPAQIDRMLQGGMGVMPIPKMEGLGKALTYIKENAGVSETPLGNLARKKRMTELMESGSEAFAESPLDAIAAQIAKAQLDTQSGANDTEIAQRIIADKKKSAAKSAAESAAAEEFRAEEAKSFDDTSMTIADSEKIAEDTFKQAMDEFLGMARGASPEDRERTLEDYKKEFAAATGVDVSGKVDKSQALMALGLGLMQNRAGKGFNVGKILNAVGQAGEKALPELEKAKNKAQTAALAAGKYALESRGSDRAKDEAVKESLKNRSQYYVYKKGKEGEAFANFDQGDLTYLNKYELNKLMENPKFNDQFSFIEGSDYFELMKNDSNKTSVDYGDPYGKETKVSLLGGDIEGVNPIYIVDAQRPDGNYKGARKKYAYMQTAPESVIANFKQEQNSILKEEEQFAELIGNIETGVSIPTQLVSSVIGFGRNLGLNLGDGPTPIAKARRKLEQIQLMNATEILQESGKTLSDQDRERVKQFVGSIDLASADEKMILRTIGRVYDIVLKARQRNLDTAVGNMERDFGMSVDLRPENKPASQAELDAMNKKDGTNLTMDDFNKPAGT
jgi:hypothetical protein